MPNVLRKLCCVLPVMALLAGCSDPEPVTRPITPPAGLQQETVPSTTVPVSREAVLEETELYREDGVTVVATALHSDLFGPSIRISAVNDSGKNVTITTEYLSVNGFMLSTSGLYCQIAAGKKANDALGLMAAELERAGITTVGEIEFYLNVSDSDTYEILGTSELITLRTSASGSFTQNVDDSGETVYDRDGIRVVCKGIQADSVWDGTVVFYLENNSGRRIAVSGEDVSVNGYMADVALWAELRPATKAVDGMYLLDLEELDLERLEEVREVEFTLVILDGDNWSQLYRTDPITVRFE